LSVTCNHYLSWAISLLSSEMTIYIFWSTHRWSKSLIVERRQFNTFQANIPFKTHKCWLDDIKTPHRYLDYIRELYYIRSLVWSDPEMNLEGDQQRPQSLWTFLQTNYTGMLLYFSDLIFFFLTLYLMIYWPFMISHYNFT